MEEDDESKLVRNILSNTTKKGVSMLFLCSDVVCHTLSSSFFGILFCSLHWGISHFPPFFLLFPFLLVLFPSFPLLLPSSLTLSSFRISFFIPLPLFFPSFFFPVFFLYLVLSSFSLSSFSLSFKFSKILLSLSPHFQNIYQTLFKGV